MPKLSVCSADVIDVTLTSISDFATLLSFITTSKFIYEVYQAHPQSIIYSVAYNQVGESLPQALRLVRSAGQAQTPVSKLPEETNAMSHSAIEPYEAASLAQNAKISHYLEDLFSWRHKDRTSRSSHLTSDESTRFQKALYRFWLYSTIYGVRGPLIDEDEEDENGPDDHIDDHFANALTKKKSFLESFSDSELNDLEVIYSFLKGTASWTAVAVINNDYWSEVSVCAGPKRVCENFEDMITNVDWDQRRPMHLMNDYYVPNFFAGPLALINEERKSGSQSDTALVPVLCRVVGEFDECARCNIRKGIDLWNKTNWDFLLGILNKDIQNYLPGRLHLNQDEASALRDEISGLGYSTFLAELFERKTNPFDTVQEQDWLCLGCLGQFIGHHLWRWWLEHKRQAGIPVAEDCWYGYNCRTMTHKPAHASRLNHLCVPIRGEA